jgi:hypothetical protein
LKSELGLLSDKEEHELKERRQEYMDAIQECADRYELELQQVAQVFNYLLFYSLTENTADTKDLFMEIPKVEGFREDDEIGLSIKQVDRFLDNSFERKFLKSTGIIKIRKNSIYQIRIPENPAYYDREAELKKEGLIDKEYGHFTRDRDSYLEVAKVLEGVKKEEDLDHRFKLKAYQDDNYTGLGLLYLNSFEFTDYREVDYLNMKRLDTDEKRMKAYALGVITHEISHANEGNLSKEQIQIYSRIIEEEKSGLRDRYVTDYVLKHERLFKSHGNIIRNEDLAETVRIYSTNPQYLMKNYPRRYRFIKENFKWIKEGSVIDFLEREGEIG